MGPLIQPMACVELLKKLHIRTSVLIKYLTTASLVIKQFDTKPCEQVTRESMAVEKMKKRRANFDKLKEKRDWLIRPFKVLSKKCTSNKTEVEMKWDKHSIVENGNKIQGNKTTYDYCYETNI